MRSHLSIWLCLLILFNPWLTMAQQDPFGEFRSADEEAFFDDPYQDMANDPLLQQDFELEPTMEDPLATESVPEGDPFEEPVQQDERYLDESVFSEETESEFLSDLMANQKLRGIDRENVSSNVMWGAATGFMVAAWFVFLDLPTSREMFRTLGTTTVIGGFLGSYLGTRSFFDSAAPRPQGVQNELPVGPVALIDPTGFRLAYTWTF